MEIGTGVCDQLVRVVFSLDGGIRILEHYNIALSFRFDFQYAPCIKIGSEFTITLIVEGDSLVHITGTLVDTCFLIIYLQTTVFTLMRDVTEIYTIKNNNNIL